MSDMVLSDRKTDNGREVEIINSNGEITLFIYDKNGNMIKKIYPDGDTHVWEYDENRNIIKYIDHNGLIYIQDVEIETEEVSEKKKIIENLKILNCMIKESK